VKKRRASSYETYPAFSLLFERLDAPGLSIGMGRRFLFIYNEQKLDEFDMSRDGIKHCNIRDFLLMDTW